MYGKEVCQGEVTKLLSVDLKGMGFDLHKTMISGPNLAFGKPTFQMDTYPGGESRKAVDGNKATDFAAGSCTRTNMKLKDKDNMNWWAVDLKKRYTINKVTLFNRGDCCGQRLANFDIVVVDTRPVPNLTLRYLKNQICAHQKGAVRQGKVGTYTCEKLVKGRYVAVVQARTEYLTLCEVEVFGTAESEYFESLC
ncbi:fucolectin-1-like [Lineus longissimus]|uniref:fucolectin-1-like n=1 Tax=Lineus longissimus TaxID=88925 RepID=UPI00315DE359